MKNASFTKCLNWTKIMVTFCTLVLISSNVHLFANGPDGDCISIQFINGVADIDVSGMSFEDINYEFIFANDSDCDYKVFFCFSTASDCSVACVSCATSAGLITANTASSSFPYSTVLTGCTGDYPCNIRILQNGASNSAFSTGCYNTLEEPTEVDCTYNGTTTTFGCDFYYCGEVKIYEL